MLIRLIFLTLLNLIPERSGPGKISIESFLDDDQRLLIRKRSVPQRFQHLLRKIHPVRRIHKDKIKRLSFPVKLPDRLCHIRGHHTSPLFQMGRLQIIPDTGNLSVSLVHKDRFLRPAAQRLDPDRPASRKKIQKSRPVKIILKHIKQSGYRSYHLIIYYTVDTIKGPKKLQAEIQIRTMAMNFWATIEHSLQYKYKGDMPGHVAERLSKAADAINALDHEMSSVRNEIMDAQNSSQMQSNLVKDILINIENLYKIANKREIMKIQDEFLRVFKTKDLQQLKRFHRQLDIISEGYRAQAVYHHV